MGIYDIALAYATKKHAGQTRFDKRTPYIEHPKAVATLVREWHWPEWAQAAAVLHDVLEDTDATYEELKDLFGEKIADTVRRLSKEEGEDYLTYILRVEKWDETRIIKLADLQHNMSDLKKGSMRDKYRLARHVLDPPSTFGKTKPSFSQSDWIYYLEIALIAMDRDDVRDDLADTMDVTDEEITRLHHQLADAMNKEGPDGKLLEEQLRKEESRGW